MGFSGFDGSMVARATQIFNLVRGSFLSDSKCMAWSNKDRDQLLRIAASVLERKGANGFYKPRVEYREL